MTQGNQLVRHFHRFRYVRKMGDQLVRHIHRYRSAREMGDQLIRQLHHFRSAREMGISSFGTSTVSDPFVRWWSAHSALPPFWIHSWDMISAHFALWPFLICSWDGGSAHSALNRVSSIWSSLLGERCTDVSRHKNREEVVTVTLCCPTLTSSGDNDNVLYICINKNNCTSFLSFSLLEEQLSGNRHLYDRFRFYIWGGRVYHECWKLGDGSCIVMQMDNTEWAINVSITRQTCHQRSIWVEYETHWIVKAQISNARTWIVARCDTRATEKSRIGENASGRWCDRGDVRWSLLQSIDKECHAIWCRR